MSQFSSIFNGGGSDVDELVELLQGHGETENNPVTVQFGEFVRIRACMEGLGR